MLSIMNDLYTMAAVSKHIVSNVPKSTEWHEIRTKITGSEFETGFGNLLTVLVEYVQHKEEGESEEAGYEKISIFIW